MQVSHVNPRISNVRVTGNCIISASRTQIRPVSNVFDFVAESINSANVITNYPLNNTNPKYKCLGCRSSYPACIAQRCAYGNVELNCAEYSLIFVIAVDSGGGGCLNQLDLILRLAAECVG